MITPTAGTLFLQRRWYPRLQLEEASAQMFGMNSKFIPRQASARFGLVRNLQFMGDMFLRIYC